MVTAVTSLGRSGLYDWLMQRVSAVILLNLLEQRALADHFGSITTWSGNAAEERLTMCMHVRPETRSASSEEVLAQILPLDPVLCTILQRQNEAREIEVLNVHLQPCRFPVSWQTKELDHVW